MKKTQLIHLDDWDCIMKQAENGCFDKGKPDNVVLSLCPHYGISLLIRVILPLSPTSILPLLWVIYLSRSLNIGATGSLVPHRSLN